MSRAPFLKVLILISILIGSVIFVDQISAGSAKDRIDLAISGGTIVTMDGNYRVIEDGYIAIRGDRIIDLGSRSEIGHKYIAKEVIDATGKAILPGLVNTHTHVPMVMFRGIADDLVLQEWLEK